MLTILRDGSTLCLWFQWSPTKLKITSKDTNFPVAFVGVDFAMWQVLSLPFSSHLLLCCCLFVVVLVLRMVPRSVKPAALRLDWPSPKT